jgi:cytidylate kinase
LYPEAETPTSGADTARGSALSQLKPKIVAVDGPAGSGKSSICYRVSERIGWTYVNTGAIYRAVGWLAAQARADLDNEAAVARVVEEIEADLRWHSHTRSLWYKDTDLTPILETEAAGSAASKVARQPLVRLRLLPVQKNLALAAPVGALVDGRDIGTVVFPDADLKIFLTASLEERSRRRLAQLGRHEGEIDATELETIRAGIARRDEQDEGRSAAPLKIAADAVVVDSSSMSVEDTISSIVHLMRTRGLLP